MKNSILPNSNIQKVVNSTTIENSISPNSSTQKVVHQSLYISKTLINYNIIYKKMLWDYFHRLCSTLYFMAQQKSQLNLCYSLYRWWFMP